MAAIAAGHDASPSSRLPDLWTSPGRRALWMLALAYRWGVPPTRPRHARQQRRAPASWAAATVLGAAGLLLVTSGCSTPTMPDEAAATGVGSVAPSPTPEDLVTAVPDEHSEVGRLTPDFPVDLLPVPDDAVILVTSSVPVGDADVQELSLNLHTAMSVPDVVDLYRTALTAAGFSEIDIPDTALAAELSFTRSGGDELVSIGVLDDNGTRTVTIGGRIHTQG
ncbi:hypothetical protein OEB99_19350 [Actinotalea sp. M2MS4P-6]|uniref:hypothetical protein n=1 Tax=Actinotalea sp. M2MS4P-6 TaxID=2983762 RepID=UPI0021E4D189|nr:hypothetical protein [Actinotalea sp. M2MS4P-6]MCV2396473.1 hypothetical protein [Actinotalea sp. M2MS4P-6]